MNEVAAAQGQEFLARYGGRISSEWYFPKLIEVFEQDRSVYDAMAVFVEAADWIVWQLTGNLVRSPYTATWPSVGACPQNHDLRAGHKNGRPPLTPSPPAGPHLPRISGVPFSATWRSLST